jgi:lambda family phage portal protein
VNSWKLELERQVRAAGIALRDDPAPEMAVSDLMAYNGQTSPSGYQTSIFDGGKFAGGFGPTQLHLVDYWTLRARSAQLFNDNLYARGIIRRLVTNEINTGLTPEASPDEGVLGLQENALEGWTESVENRFSLWGKSPVVCDWYGEATFGALQRAARSEALVEGDVLVVLRPGRQTGVPAVQLVKGSCVQTPLGEYTPRAGSVIKHGVEFDSLGRVSGYHVRQTDGSFKRLPAYGEKSGRRLAWLVFGTDKRLDDVRGQPLLALVLQSLKEIDRYRDSAQRKAVINSILAMFVTKTSDKMGTLPITGGAVRRDSVDVSDNTTGGVPRKFNSASMIPGLVVEELQVGESIVTKGGEGTDVAFGVFEEAIIQAVAWANEIPPEILRLAFSNNYSASQAAINEFKIYLNRVWSGWGEEFCTPIYIEWLVSENLRGNLRAPGLLEAWRDPAKHAELAAWVSAHWYGSIKPSTDMLKQVRASELLCNGGFTTRARESRGTTGTKFSHNVKRLRTENVQLAEAMRPLLELQREFGPEAVQGGLSAVMSRVDGLSAQLEDALGDQSPTG